MKEVNVRLLISKEAIKNAIRKMKSGKIGNGIVAGVLTQGGEALVEGSRRILVHVRMLERHLLYIFTKVKREKKVYANYRGVSLLSIPGKVLCVRE